MQGIRNKKLWFFFVLGIMILATVCIWKAGREQKTVYANGRVVERTVPQVKWRMQT